MDQPDRKVRLYQAMIWIRDLDRPGQRVSVRAENLKEAQEKLEAEYGEGKRLRSAQRRGCCATALEGRFTFAEGGVNLYAYVNNDPLNLLDP